MIDTAIDQCYECQVTTKGDREEPIKVTSIPSRPRDTVSIDHGGLYPEGHYNLVLIDKRTRYPEIIPEQETESKQRVEHNQQVDRAAVTTPRRKRRQLHISRTMC